MDFEPVHRSIKDDRSFHRETSRISYERFGAFRGQAVDAIVSVQSET
jgi:hypothetical protein